MARRRSVDGSIAKRHLPDCPKPADGVRPEHRCDGLWQVSVDLGTRGGKRRRRTKYARTEKEAKAIRRAMLRELDAGRLGDDCTLAEWLTYWLSDIAPETMSERTLRNHRGHVDYWITPQLGRLPLTEIRPDDVRRLRRHLETAKARRGDKPLSPSTARYIMTTLTAALEAAVTERRILWNPAKAVAKPALTGDHHRHWAEPAHARRMIDAATSPREQARFAVALYAGLRQGEALGLTWDDVDLDARTITVRQTAAYVPGQGMVVKPGAKTRYSLRTIPMHNLVHALLTEHRKTAVGRFVFGDDEPGKASRDYHDWRAGCARAGLPVISPHGARATTATLLREAGVPVSTIGEILGHKPGSTVTELSYAHAQPAELSAAIDRLG